MTIDEVLKFYANKDNYKFNSEIHATHDSVIAEDGGRMAREFLEKLNEKPNS